MIPFQSPLDGVVPVLQISFWLEAVTVFSDPFSGRQIAQSIFLFLPCGFLPPFDGCCSHFQWMLDSKDGRRYRLFCALVLQS